MGGRGRGRAAGGALDLRVAAAARRRGRALGSGRSTPAPRERSLPVPQPLDGVDATRALGARLAAALRAGDLLVLSGPLGAGKTALTQGIGAALGVRGRVTSPTFVLARVHRGPLPLVHVDAYRLRDSRRRRAALADLDLDGALEDSRHRRRVGRGPGRGPGRRVARRRRSGARGEAPPTDGATRRSVRVRGARPALGGRARAAPDRARRAARAGRARDPGCGCMRERMP